MKDFYLFLDIDGVLWDWPYLKKEIDEGRGTSPIVDNGRTLVPIRSIIEECGGTVGWNGDTQTVTLNYKNDEIKLIINSTTAYLNGEANTLDVAAQPPIMAALAP